MRQKSLYNDIKNKVFESTNYLIFAFEWTKLKWAFQPEVSGGFEEKSFNIVLSMIYNMAFYCLSTSYSK